MEVVSNTVKVQILNVGARDFQHQFEANHKKAQQATRKIKNQHLLLSTAEGGQKLDVDGASERRIPSQDAPVSVGDRDNIPSTDLENTKDERAASVISYLCNTTENSPDCSYVTEWHFFLEAKGRILSYSDTLCAYLFAAGFIEQWQDAWIHIPVRCLSTNQCQ